jgi:citrate/tricarballylate utilization protein
MVTGLCVLLTRTTPAFAGLLVVHLAAVIVAFAITPYTKFFHWVYRVLSIQHDNLESARRRNRTA